MELLALKKIVGIVAVASTFSPATTKRSMTRGVGAHRCEAWVISAQQMVAIIAASNNVELEKVMVDFPL